MLFTSYAFLGFAAVTLLLYYLIPGKFQWVLLLAASYVFYAIADVRYLIYILSTTVSVWLAAHLIEENMDAQTSYLKAHSDLSPEQKKAWKNGQRGKRKRILVLCLLWNLGVLAVVKYTNFALDNINTLFGLMGKDEALGFVDIALPMGISFYTFQAVGYLVDVFRGTVPAEKNPFRFALFVSFFPQLVQGPISRFGDLSATLYQPHRFDGARVSRGCQRILWGYFKKLVVADRIYAAVSVMTADPATYGGAYAAVTMLFYTVELYADFTGGIDITIGIAEAMGITVMENFNRPYFSKSLKEYWRRWHISMSAWFRDYVFYPLSVSKGMQKFSKNCRKKLGDKVGKRLPVYLSSFVVWLATGVWHGASWNFIVWGLANWLVLMASEELEPCYARFHQRFAVDGKLWYRVLQIGRTFILVAFLNLFDCYSSVADTLRQFGSLFTVWNPEVLWNGSLMEIGLSAADYGVLAVAVALLLAVSLVQRRGSVRDLLRTKPYALRAAAWYVLFLATLLMGAYGIGYDASQFIYNRF